MQKIYNDGTDQELYFKGVKSDLSGEFAGTVDGESLPGAIVQIKEYKLAFTEVLGTTVIWDALAGYWFVTIPAAYITQSGSMLVAVAGTGMKNVTIDADVLSETLDTIAADIAGISVTGGGGAEKVIPRTYYELSAAANTITLSSPYDTITEEQIISICDLTTGDVIYSCEIPIRHTISVSSGVITFTYDNTSIAAEDILQIIVNQV